MIDEKKYVPPRVDDDDDDADDKDVTILSSDDDDSPDVDAILAEFAAVGSYVLLERKESYNWFFLDRIDMADASLTAIKERFGGGKYRMRIMGEKGRKRRQVTFFVAGRSKLGDEELNGSGAPAPVAPTDEVLQLRERLRELEDKIKTPAPEGGTGRDRLMDAIVARLMEPPKVDPLMGTLITALVGKGRDNSGGNVDPIELQKLLSDARREGYENGKQLGEAIAASMGEGDGVARVLATAIPSVVDAFKSAQTAYVRSGANGNPPAQSQPTAAANATPLPSTTSEETVMPAGWVSMLRPAVPLILKWARTGKNAQVKAENTIDDLNDNVREAIAVQAEDPNFVGAIMAQIPEFMAADVQPWVVTFLSTVQEILAPAIEEGGEGGDGEAKEA